MTAVRSTFPGDVSHAPLSCPMCCVVFAAAESMLCGFCASYLHIGYKGSSGKYLNLVLTDLSGAELMASSCEAVIFSFSLAAFLSYIFTTSHNTVIEHQWYH